MPRAGRALRMAWALEREGDKLCECGHQMRGHRELPPTWSIEDGALVETPNPNYKPLHFHCAECDCVHVERAT